MPLAQLRRRLLTWWFLRDTGARTADSVALEELGLAHPERNEYAPSSWLYLGWALRGHPLGPSDAFVDFGCGMGRVVLQAARRPFARVVGVELAPELVDIARRNAGAARGLKCPDVSFVVADATRFVVPDDMTVAYFFNPFTGATFSAVMGQITASLGRRPRVIRLIYVHPVEADEVLASGHFEEVQRRRSRRKPHYEVIVFESHATGTPRNARPARDGSRGGRQKTGSTAGAVGRSAWHVAGRHNVPLLSPLPVDQPVPNRCSPGAAGGGTKSFGANGRRMAS